MLNAILCMLRYFNLRYNKEKRWRLKIGDGGKDPYLFSTNNFVGRQTWEFNPEAGTPEERAQVEAARLNFFKNRFHVKPCADLLWRFQVWSVCYFKSSINYL